MTEKEEYMLENLAKHSRAVKSYYTENKLVGVFVVGDWNYGLDTGTAVLDTVAIVLPSVEQYSCGEIKLVKTLKIGESACVVKSLPSYVNELKRLSSNALEVLNTFYCMVEEEESGLWSLLVENREVINRSDPYSLLQDCLGNAYRCSFAYANRNKSRDIAELYKRVTVLERLFNLDNLKFSSLSHQDALYLEEGERNLYQELKVGGTEETETFKNLVEVLTGVDEKIRGCGLSANKAEVKVIYKKLLLKACHNALLK